MFGLSKKKHVESLLPPTNAHVRVIPNSFYGGQNPAVYAPSSKSVSAAPSSMNVPVESKKTVPVMPSPVVSSPVPPQDNNSQEKQQLQTPPLDNRLWLLRHPWAASLIGGMAVLVVGGGISWYYIFRPTQSKTPVTIVQKPQTNQAAKPVPQMPDPTPVTPTASTTATTSPVVVPVPTSTPATTTLPSRVSPLTFPQIFLANSPDADADSLTDSEEEMFGIDSGAWDTDGDGYYDGQEVFNLYNPKGFAPVRIIDSGLVREYVNSNFGYRIYYPVGFEVGEVDREKTDVLFTAVTGDFIEIRAMETAEARSFDDWFAATVNNQRFSDLVPFTNRFQEKGYHRSDDLVAYFPTQNVVYVLVYHPGTMNAIPFRHIMQMMMQSFRPGITSNDIATQPRLPQPSVPATSSSEASQG